MHELDGYEVRDRLYARSNKAVLRVRRRADGLHGVLKYFDTDAHRRPGLEKVKNEFACVKTVRSEYVIQVYDLVLFEHGVGILMEDFDAESLAHALRKRTLVDLPFFLDVAAKISRGLRDIHQHKLIHRDIKPSNILFDQDTGDLKIIDFGISRSFSESNVGHRDGSLPYMSPEQTGKMNRSVDLRSDLYSLGVIFYELLLGRCPFTSEDPLELVHAHVAKVPRDPREMDPSIRRPISEMIMRLLSKEADSRYQSADGVLADLEEIASYVDRGEEIPNTLTIGTRDRPQVFLIPEKLYGRQTELGRLLQTYSSVTATGSFEAVLVSGYSGIGKSALIHEAQRTLVAARGFLAAGKYEPFSKAQPYSAIQQALAELVRGILRRPDPEVQSWRERLTDALDGEGQCLVDVVPLLEGLLGPQQQLPDAGPVSRQNRFNRACSAMLGVFATPSQPLVLFLDDAQWADLASLDLVRSWIHSRIPNMMLILAYRDNEVGPHHPLTVMLNAMGGEEGFPYCRIPLASIAQADVAQWLADTLRCDADRLAALSEVLMSKTGGNPFFLIQMFRSLYEDDLLRFGPQGWSWDLQEITARSLTDNMVDLMTNKLHRYPEETGSALNMGAVLGSEFELRQLALVLEVSNEKAYKALLPALEDGLLTEAPRGFRFVHDKVHEASYGLVPSQERRKRHRVVGRYLLETLDEVAVEEQLFKIVEDLNRSRELIPTEAERVELAALNVRAGQKALASSAFAPSADLFSAATQLLADDAWSRWRDLTLAAHFGLASANYACAQYGECERNVRVCLDKVRDPVRAAPFVQLLLGSLFSQNRYDDSVSAGVQAVERLLGRKVPAAPTKAQVLRAYLTLKLRQGLRPTASLVDLPPARDERATGALGVLNALLPSAYMMNSNLYALIATLMAQLSIRYGNTAFSPLAYACCMVTEMSVFKSIQSGEEYLKLAFAVNERYPNAQERAQIELIRSCLSMHQTRSLGDWEQEANAAVAHNLDTGALHFADYVLAFTRTQAIFFGTRSLDDVYRANLDVLQLHRLHGDQEVIQNQLFILHTLSRWRGEVADEGEMLDDEIEHFDVTAYEHRLQGPGNIMPRGYLAVLRQVQEYLEGNYEASLRIGLSFKLKALDLLGVLNDHIHRFFFMLAHLAANTEKLTRRERIESAAYYRINHAIFGIYDRNAPNFSSHVALIEAEEHRNQGRSFEAIQAYERAIQQARGISRFNEALVYRRLASFYQTRGLQQQALMVALQARAVYLSMAFRSEVRRLEESFPNLAIVHGGGRHTDITRPRTGSRDSSSTLSDRLDLESLARAAQAISSQMRLEGLIESLLHHLCQSSAAQRVVLLLQERDHLRVQGEIVVTGEHEALSVLQGLDRPADRPEGAPVPETLIQYVARVRKTEVLRDASHEGGFTQDPYIREHPLKSLLCMPIANQGKLLGVLYLENNLATDAFTPEHQEVVEVLAAQAAISFENARLYRNLEQKVEERTAELRRRTNDINGMLQNLEQGVFTILQDETIHHEYSRHLEVILGTKSIAGRDYVEVLFAHTTLSDDVLHQMRSAVSFSVGFEVLWFESNRHLLVRELVRELADGTLQTLELNWTPILTEDGIVEKLLVSVKDISGLRRLELQAREQRHDLEMLAEILAVPRSVFLGFLHGTEERLEQCRGLLKQTTPTAETLAALFRSIHTVKGSARAYGFRSLAQAAHQAEDSCARCRQLPVTDWDAEPIRAELREVSQCARRYRRVYERNLEAFSGLDAHSTVVDNELLDQIRAAAKSNLSGRVASLVDAVGTSALEDVVAAAAGSARDVARELDKPVPRIRAISHGVRFHQEAARTLRDVFIHMLRNSVDHGIEPVDERRKSGKPEQGEIEFIARACDEGCEVLVRDDGRGLSMARLRALAAERSLPAEPDPKLAELVFISGVSTAGAVTNSSGRGVGMDAVRRFVAERGGEVQLLLDPGDDDFRTFVTRIVLPAEQVLTIEVSPSRSGTAQSV